MKRSKVLTFSLLAVTLICSLSACKTLPATTPDTGKIGPQVTNSRTTYDWKGVYVGNTPCADCAGIDLELVLNEDLTYTLKRTYDNGKGRTFTHTGKFEWNAIGTQVTLQGINEQGAFEHFLVNDQKVMLLDIHGDVIEHIPASDYELIKATPAVMNLELTNKYWKLVELNGQPIQASEKVSNDAFLTFKANGVVSGSLSCNTFGGSFTLQEGNRMKFSQLAVTQKMCLDMTIETALIDVLNRADNYNLIGDTLTLNRARMAPLARFEAVYM